uniref:Uncharacterized protein n=1 Tax=Pristionchus pacificus TaxID=54126 RepID=A0A2A6B3K3_PRIPA|eukprot:PDM60454.1 hypothetical protein PRIPAC_53432 [Pristionchus pacificus]
MIIQYFTTYAVARNVSEWRASARATALVSTVNRGRDSLWRGAADFEIHNNRKSECTNLQQPTFPGHLRPPDHMPPYQRPQNVTPLLLLLQVHAQIQVTSDAMRVSTENTTPIETNTMIHG